MKKRIIAPAIVGVLWLSMHIPQAGAATVTVRMIDETTIRGELKSVDATKITVEPNATTRPTTRASVDMADVAQVVFREPAAARVAQDNSQQQGSGLFGTLTSIFGGSSDSDTPGPTEAPPPPPPHVEPPPTTRPVAEMQWTMKLKTGDLLHGHVSQWSGQNLTIKLNAPLSQTLAIPSNQVVELWCGSDASRQKAAAMKMDSDAQDVVFVEKEGHIVSVKGIAVDIAGSALRFRLGDDERKIALGRLVGIIFAHTAPAEQTDALHEAFRLDTGDNITGSWTGVDKKSASLKTAWGPTLQLPLARIYSIDFLGGRAVYLSDLTPAKVEQTPYFGRVIPFRLDRSLEGGPLKLSDGVYPKGIAVHSRCVLQYQLDGAFARFQTKLGFEDPAGKMGEVSARVMGDGNVLYENPDARGDQKPVKIDVSVSNVKTLTLEVDFGKGQDVAGRVVWANARLLHAKGAQ